jgi:hypothetical protein
VRFSIAPSPFAGLLHLLAHRGDLASASLFSCRCLRLGSAFSRLPSAAAAIFAARPCPQPRQSSLELLQLGLERGRLAHQLVLDDF